jgi:hypothetical protein
VCRFVRAPQHLPPPAHLAHAASTRLPASRLSPTRRLPQRAREVLHDFKSAFRREAAGLQQRRDAALLYSSLRGGGGGGVKGAADMSAVDALLRERGSLSSSGRAIDDVLATAADTHNALARQRAALAGAAGRLGTYTARLPGVGGLMDAIHRRRVRNDQVLAVVIAACLCFALWWLVLRKY